MKTFNPFIRNRPVADRQPTASRPQRRTVHFDDLSRVVPDVRRFRTRHRTLGRWSLGQICTHLARSIDGSIDGFNLRRHRIKRKCFRKALLWYTFRFGIPLNYTVDPALEPGLDVGTDSAIEALQRAVERYRSHDGPLKPHPLFGRMPRQTWDRLHCLHCGHHLSFVVEADAP